MNKNNNKDPATKGDVESVEYTKLRMRIDALEYDMEKVKEKVKK